MKSSKLIKTVKNAGWVERKNWTPAPCWETIQEVTHDRKVLVDDSWLHGGKNDP